MLEVHEEGVQIGPLRCYTKPRDAPTILSAAKKTNTATPKRSVRGHNAARNAKGTLGVEAEEYQRNREGRSGRERPGKSKSRPQSYGGGETTSFENWNFSKKQESLRAFLAKTAHCSWKSGKQGNAYSLPIWERKNNPLQEKRQAGVSRIGFCRNTPFPIWSSNVDATLETAGFLRKERNGPQKYWASIAEL